MATKKSIGLDKQQLSTTTITLLERGFKQVHDRVMTPADLKVMQLIDAKHYFKLGKGSADQPDTKTAAPIAKPNKKKSTKVRVALASVAGLALLTIASPSAPADTKTVTPAAKSEIVVPVAETAKSPAEPAQETVTPKAVEPTPQPAPQPAPVVMPVPTPAPSPAASSSCDPNYSGGCVPNVSYDLNCPDIDFTVQVVGTDKHRFDRDKDGVGCEQQNV